METRSRIAILMSPPALCLLVLFVAPLVLMAIFTFRAGTFGDARQVFTLEHYYRFLESTAFQQLLWRSIVTAFIVSVIAVVLSYPVAYFLAYHAGSMRLTLLTVIIIPAWTSYLLRVLSWKIILGSSGVLTSFLQWAGITEQTLPVLLYNRNAVIITLVYVWIPFVALPIFVALDRIDRDLLEAAADLGTPPWEAFLRVTLPLSMPGVIAGFLFVFIPTVGEYVTPALVGGPNGIMYGNVILDQFLNALNWPFGSLMSMVMLIAVLLPILVFSRLVRFTNIMGV